jgi:hypothetical protein
MPKFLRWQKKGVPLCECRHFRVMTVDAILNVTRSSEARTFIVVGPENVMALVPRRARHHVSVQERAWVIFQSFKILMVL